MRAHDRTTAGRDLGALVAAELHRAADQPLVVVGLPRGGVPVAAEVAAALDAPLDIVLVRKLGVPGHRELAMGAVGEHGAVVWNLDLIHRLGITDRHRHRAAERGRAELAERAVALRGDRAPIMVQDATVVVVDDGIATGATARAAATVLRAGGAARLVLAAPVGPAGFDGAPQYDQTIIGERPVDFMAVGQHYVDFRATTDAEVIDLLGRARS